jgi:hypothetical protein
VYFYRVCAFICSFESNDIWNWNHWLQTSSCISLRHTMTIPFCTIVLKFSLDLLRQNQKCHKLIFFSFEDLKQTLKKSNDWPQLMWIPTDSGMTHSSFNPNLFLLFSSSTNTYSLWWL